MNLRKAINKNIKATNRKEKINKLKRDIKKKFETKTLEQRVLDVKTENTLSTHDQIVIGTLVKYKTIPGSHIGLPYGCIRTSDEHIMQFVINGEIIETRNSKIFYKCDKIIGKQYKLIYRTTYLKEGSVRHYIIDIFQ